MVDEVSSTDSAGTGSSHTTVIRERGSGAGWLIGIVLLIAVIAGIYFFSRMSGSETAKDNAVANAANDVGSAAKKAGDAVDNK